MQAKDARSEPPPGIPHVRVWDLFPGLGIRIAQTFRDFDGQEIPAGAMLGFRESTYFGYDGGHTLYFYERTIRLASVDDDNELVIENTGNKYFEPVIARETLSNCCGLVKQQWDWLAPTASDANRGIRSRIREDIDACGRWLETMEGGAPLCESGVLISQAIPVQNTLGLGWRVGFLFDGVLTLSACG